MEVWNGSFHVSHSVNQQAFEFWDKINIRRERHYYGTSGTDGHNASKIGDLHVRGSLGMLSAENVTDLLASGQFYGTYGPDLRFNINGVGMGKTLTVTQAGNLSINLEAFSKDGNLTNVRVLGYPVTGNMADYAKGTVVYEKDLTNENTDTYEISFKAKVKQNMFFRLEVKSEKATEGSVGNGPEAGTGFAYSNLVWVNVGSQDSSLDIKKISYDKKKVTAVSDGFGRKIIYVDAEAFDVNKVQVDADGTVESKFSAASSNNSGVLGILDILVSTSNTLKATHSFIVCQEGSFCAKPRFNPGTKP